MQETYLLNGLVIRRRPWLETDKLITLYTLEQGMIDLVAKGSQKTESKLAGHLEPYNHVKVMAVKGRGADYLGSADSQQSFLSLKSDLHKLSAVGRLWHELIRLIRSREPDRDIYNLLVQYLMIIDRISSGPEYYQALTDLAAWRLIGLLGQAPQFDQNSKVLLFYNLRSAEVARQKKDYGDWVAVSPGCAGLIMQAQASDLSTLVGRLKLTNARAKELNRVSLQIFKSIEY